MQQLFGNESSISLRVREEPRDECSTSIEASLPAPQSAQELAGHYDLTISRPSSDRIAFRAFDRWLAAAAAQRGLSCCLIHDGVVREAIDRLLRGTLQIGFHLDYFSLWHIAGDPYARLAHAVADSGGQTINLPSRSRYFTNKAWAHASLSRRGLGVPATAIVQSGVPEVEWAVDGFGLPLDGQATLYVKPANGFGSSGVVRVEQCTSDRLRAALSESRQRHPADDLLVQREVTCPRLHAEDGIDRLAYWRLVYCLGELVPFWWHKSEMDQSRPSYQRVSGADIKRLQLRDVLEYGLELARLCGLNWFSTELCASEGDESSRFHVPGTGGKRLPVVAIDYVNDQCDVDVQSRWLGGPPDAFVRHAANRFADAALARRECLPFPNVSSARPIAA